jgi:hypothetical protein
MPTPGQLPRDDWCSSLAGVRSTVAETTATTRKGAAAAPSARGGLLPITSRRPVAAVEGRVQVALAVGRGVATALPPTVSSWFEEWDEPDYVSVKCRDPDGHIVEASWEPQR